MDGVNLAEPESVTTVDGKTPAETEQARIVSALVEKSKNGDLEAFGELIRLYRERAFGLAYSFLNNHHDAEDISQEAFIQAFKKLESFDASGSFGAWLLTIVANMAKNRIRWRKVREKFTFSLDAGFDANGDGERVEFQIPDKTKDLDPLANVEKMWASARLAAQMSELPARQRTTVHLKFVQGFTIPEIAKMMNLAQGTVKSHIFRGIESLKKTIERAKDEM